MSCREQQEGCFDCKTATKDWAANQDLQIFQRQSKGGPEACIQGWKGGRDCHQEIAIVPGRYLWAVAKEGYWMARCGSSVCGWGPRSWEGKYTLFVLFSCIIHHLHLISYFNYSQDRRDRAVNLLQKKFAGAIKRKETEHESTIKLKDNEIKVSLIHSTL